MHKPELLLEVVFKLDIQSTLVTGKTFSEFLNKFAESFTYGKQALEIALRHSQSYLALNRIFYSDIRLKATNEIAAADIDLSWKGPEIRVYQELDAMDLMSAVVHEVTHYENKLGKNMVEIFKDMTYSEFFNYMWEDEVKAFTKQASALIDYNEMGYGKGKNFWYMTQLPDIKEYIMSTVFTDGFTYPKQWLDNYSVKECYLNKVIL